jgi:hypothetical protein
MSLAIAIAAARCADRVWPIAGDPTHAQKRRDSGGWMAAYEGFLSGVQSAMRDPEQTAETLVTSEPDNTAASAGWDAGARYALAQ